MVTAELAVAILAALTLMIMLCWSISLVVLQMRCLDLATEVARQEARHDAQAVRRVEQDAPEGAQIEVERNRSRVVVTVRLLARPLAAGLGSVPLQARAEVVPEPEAQR
jgi:hypothetical protein